MKILKEAIDDSEKVEVVSDGKRTEVVVDVTVTAGDDPAPATKEDAIRIKNALTDCLDEALDDVVYYSSYASTPENMKNINSNVLVTGLPGSSKTQTVKAWCTSNGCNYYYLDAKNPDLNVLLSGASCIDKSDPEHPKVTTAYTDIYKKLSKPNLILFLDELNRQPREYLRGSLLSLMADKALQGDTDDGFITIPNLLFTVACVNPVVDSDAGATPLNEAEKRRFYFHVQFNSTVQSTEAFLSAKYDQWLKNLARDYPDAAIAIEDPKFIQTRRDLVITQWIGKMIINDPRFKYPSLDDFKNTDAGDAKTLCQAVVTELLDHSRGQVARMLKHLPAVNLVPDAAKALKDILEGLPEPDLKELIKAKETELGINLHSDTLPDSSKKAGSSSEETEDDEDEGEYEGIGDDEDDFTPVDSTTSHAKEAKITAEDAKKRILDGLSHLKDGDFGGASSTVGGSSKSRSVADDLDDYMSKIEI